VDFIAKKGLFTKDNIILGGMLLGGGYLLYRYFTPKKIADTITDYTIKKTWEYAKTLPNEYYNRSKVFSFNSGLKTKVKGAEQTEQFINIAGIITRVNPFTAPVSPIIDWVLSKTSGSINKNLGGYF